MPGNGVSGRSKPSESSYTRIYAVVNRIPAGRVATYGQVAALAGLPGHARQVGYALNALPDGHCIPWHRVINSKGQISTRAESGLDNLQLVLLEAEGVVFEKKQRVSLQEYGWEPGSRQQQCVLFDWGDTVMRVFPEYSGPMASWPRTEAIPGIGEALTEIRRDALVCLATNAADSTEGAIRRALERVGLDVLFDRVFCFDKVGARKPTPDFFQFILKDLGLDSRSVFMVGDDFVNDVLGANANGICAVWLNRKTQEDRSGPRCKTISSPDTLVGALESLGFHRAKE
jgi:alkylated DNA nucleotide flippase Atl1/predicted HAD superfamily phosphohydrolase YqeG